MKIKINNYAFDKTAKTITFRDYTSINLDGVLLITNVVSNIVIYNFTDPLKGGTISGNVLTLDYDTSSMSNTDILQIFYDDANTNAATDESILLLRRIVKELESNFTIDRSMRQRVTLDALQLAPAGTTTELTGTIPISAASGAIMISASTGFQSGLGFGQPVTGTVPYTTNTLLSSWYTPIWEGPVDQRWRVAEDSHTAYQLGIRSHLSFT